MSRKNVMLALTWYHPKIHEGVALYAGERHWNLHFRRVTEGSLIPTSWNGDGVIIGADWKKISGLIRQNPRMEGRVVRLDHPNPGQIKVPCVSDDHIGVVDAAVEYFKGKGFKSFACYSPEVDSKSVRMSYYLEQIKKLGYECHKLISDHDDWKIRHAWLVNELRKLPSSTAVFCQNDEYASEVLQAAVDGGVSIPSHLSVLGVRNDALICDYLRPKLSSVDNNLIGVGYKAASLLDKLINDEHVEPLHYAVPPLGVVERESSSMSVAEQEDPAYYRAMLEIKANYLDPDFSCSVLAEQSGLSLRNLYKVFGRHSVASPSVEIQLMRLQEAKRLLEETSDTMEMVAERSGFGSARVLYKVFHQHEGISPGVYRKRLKA